MKPYYEQDGIRIFHGDCRDVLPRLQLEYRTVSLITDPTWPNCAVPLYGSDNAVEMFASMWGSLPELPSRAAIHLGCDSDPRFLSVVPAALPFFRVAWLEL